MEQPSSPDPEGADVGPGGAPDFNPASIPRWGQVVAGVLLLPIALLSSVGAASIFGIPKVQGDPRLQLLAVAICLLCLWTVVLAVRLIFGLQGRYGLMGPLVLRIISITAVCLVIGGLFTGVWREYPFRTALLSIIYIMVAVRTWKVADYRSRSVA